MHDGVYKYAYKFSATYLMLRLFVISVTGVRQVQDIFVRLIDSATKQVGTNIFISLRQMCSCSTIKIGKYNAKNILSIL